MARLLLLSFAFCVMLPSLGQEEAEAVFNKAIGQLMTQDVEMVLEIKEWSSSSRYKLKKYSVLIGVVDTKEKIKTVVLQPEKAKGITILIEKGPKDDGLIQVYTPANGKIRKLKATPKNMALVGSGSSINSIGTVDSEKMRFDPIAKEKCEDTDCYKITTYDKVDPSKGKTVYWIGKSTYRIFEVKEFDSNNKEISSTLLSDYKPIEGVTNKNQPMRIVYFDNKSSKKNEISILQITTRQNLSKEDFEINQINK